MLAVEKNKRSILLVFFIYLVINLAIGIVNFPYLDDVGRQLWGYSKFAEGYSRWGSEILAWVIQGSRHLTDLGLVSSILTAIILTISSSIVVYVLNDKKLQIIPMIVSTIVGINPWFLQNISFRFDAPFYGIQHFVLSHSISLVGGQAVFLFLDIGYRRLSYV